MTNKAASALCAAFVAASLAYYITLTVINPRVIAFADVWLLLAGAFLFAAWRLLARGANARYTFMGRAPRPAKRAVIAVGAVCAALASVNLFFIFTPATASSPAVRYVIVLGGGVRQNGTLTDQIILRLSAAKDALDRFPEARAVVTGGKVPFAAYAEAPVMAAALRAMGVDRERILTEDQAQDTIQNLSYSARVIAEDAGVPVEEALEIPVAIVTSDYHVARALCIARRLGFSSAYGVKAPTPAVFTLNSYAREILSYVKLNLRILFTGSPARLT